MAMLYLHIGTSKTGTSAIQKFCDDNREQLARRGCCYPLMPYKYKDVKLRRNGHFLVVPRQSSDGSFESEAERRVWHRRIARVARLFRKYPNVILSDEGIWNGTSLTSPGMWRNLKRAADEFGFQLRVIVYLRRQDSLVTSLWAQRVKVNRGKFVEASWEEALARVESWVELNYYRHLEEIAGVFGRDAIDVRIYERERFPEGNVILDFLSAIGLTMDESFKLPGNDTNASIGGNALEIRRIVNNVPGIRYGQLMRAYRAADAYYLIEKQKVTYSLFSDEELRDFLARYEEGNRMLSRDYLGGGDESPFPPPKPQPPKWTPDNPYMYEAFKRFIELYMEPQRNEYVAWLGRFFRRNGKRLRQMLSGWGRAHSK